MDAVLSKVSQNINVRSVLVGGLSLLGLWWLRVSFRKPKGIPPGPKWTVPLFGDILTLKKPEDGNDVRMPIRRLRKKYGEIFSVYIGSRLFIFINGFDLLKEVLVKRGDVFSDRPYLFISHYFSKGKGVALSSGKRWKIQRKFALETLREFGFGRSILEDKILEEVEAMINDLRSKSANPLDMCRIIQRAVSNVISSLVFGRRFEYNDPVFLKYLEAVEEDLEVAGSMGIINAVPFLRFLPGDPFKFWRTVRNVNFFRSRMTIPSIMEHKKNFNVNDMNDYIARYIHEMKNMEESGHISDDMDEFNLIQSISGLFIAGTETTSTTILWTILHFLHYPEIYERCCNEVQDVIGWQRLPSMKDKISMPYLEAVIMEILRRTNIAIFNVPHAVSHDVELEGYLIPKDAIIIPNLDSVLSDDAIWGDAEAFRPERFLDEDGKVLKPEKYIPFSMGRRNCLGESLAKMELFLFLAVLIQRFDFQPVDKNNLPSLKGSFGITHSPLKYQVKVIPR